MSYEYITDYDAVAYTAGRQGQSVDKIIIHHWGADGQTFDAVVGWFQNASCQTSAHYVVEADRVACMVNLSDTAYHAGDWNANLTSIGIECRPEMSAGDLETVCELVADLYGLYGVLPIYGHKDFSATACPGRYYAQLDYIKARAIELMSGEEDDNMGLTAEEIAWVKMMYANSQATEPDAWATDALADAVAKGVTDGERPRDAAKREEVAIMISRALAK